MIPTNEHDCRALQGLAALATALALELLPVQAYLFKLFPLRIDHPYAMPTPAVGCPSMHSFGTFSWH